MNTSSVQPTSVRDEALTILSLLGAPESAFARAGIPVLPNKKIPQRLARFRQINMDNVVTHHGALEFPDGPGDPAHASVRRSTRAGDCSGWLASEFNGFQQNSLRNETGNFIHGAGKILEPTGNLIEGSGKLRT
jgi:hypothetical protein